jgi:hypothetical protein
LLTAFLFVIAFAACARADDPAPSDPQQSPSPEPQASQPGGQNGSPNIFRRWFDMGERTQREQPDWLSPLATTSGRIKQELRYDIFHQPAAGGTTDYNFGGSKGLEFIVAPRLQLLIGPPPYVTHTSSAPNGFADIPLMMKFRLASAPSNEGNYLLTFIFNATVPGGPSSQKDAILSPGVAAGKGWGNFDVQTTLSGNLPTGDLATIGRQIVSNTAFQYRVLGKFYPELEVNSTFYVVGKNSGETQVFLTPGLGFGRIRVWRALKFSAGAGMQIAATQFHTYNHRAILSIRYSF